MNRYGYSALLFLWIGSNAWATTHIPPGFVYLSEVDPTILQDIRYAGDHNFVGRPIEGYHAGTCILTKKAAKELSNVQKELNKIQLSLKVYDCYRPTTASKDFFEWSRVPDDQLMKQEFYPRVNKQDFFELGYVALYSAHSRGSTVDLTIVPLKAAIEPSFKKGQKLFPCYEGKRYPDNSIDMGSGYDCLDKSAHFAASNISLVAKKNRELLRTTMQNHGFVPYEQEWWHFSLRNEPFMSQYFDFPIQ